MERQASLSSDGQVLTLNITLIYGKDSFISTYSEL